MLSSCSSWEAWGTSSSNRLFNLKWLFGRFLAFAGVGFAWSRSIGSMPLHLSCNKRVNSWYPMLPPPSLSMNSNSFFMSSKLNFKRMCSTAYANSFNDKAPEWLVSKNLKQCWRFGKRSYILSLTRISNLRMYFSSSVFGSGFGYITSPRSFLVPCKPLFMMYVTSFESFLCLKVWTLTG